MQAITRISRHYTWQLFLSSGLLAISSTNFGFDQGGYSQIQAMNPFIKQFGGKCNAKGVCTLDSEHLSLLNGFPFLGLFVGILMGSMVSARFGRRWTVFLMSLWALMAASISISSKTYGQILAGRIINYAYTGMELSVIPVFQVEITPAAVRGFAAGSYQMSLATGQFLISIVCHFSSRLNTNLCWRIPLACFYLIPTIVAAGVWFIPESPRYLLSKGKNEEARSSLRRLRVDRSEEAIESEIEFIQLGIAAHHEMGQSTWLSMFQGTTRRRTLITIFVTFTLQWSGQALASTYATLFVKSLNSINPFNYTLISNGINVFGVILNMYCLDLVGRRPLLLAGMSTQCITMYLLAGVGSHNSKQAHAAAVAFIALFSFAYQAGWAPATWVTVPEISDQVHRDKNQRVGAWVNVLSNCVITFMLPYLTGAPANWGPKVGYLFGSLCLIGVIGGYFIIPELKGRSNEEINLLFDRGISARKSNKWRPENVTNELVAMVDDPDAVKLHGGLQQEAVDSKPVEV